MKLNKQIFGWLGASALLLTTACTDNDKFAAEPQNDAAEVVYGNGSNIVSVSLNPTGSIATRYEANPNVPSVGDGTKVDVLVFAVYKKAKESDDDDATFEIAEEFQSLNPNFENSGITLGTGQNAVKAAYADYPLELKLALDPDYKYKVVCWAQKGEVTAFNTKDLKAVKVNYKNLNNNYEDFDAFAGVSKVINGAAKHIDPIILTRPFAQINVGTSGADLNNIMSGKFLTPNKRFRYSKITLTGVANRYNVMNGKSWADKEATDGEAIVAELGWSPIIAYINADHLPLYTEYLNDNQNIDLLQYTAALLNEDGDQVEDEEFLRVKLNDPETDSFEIEGVDDEDEGETIEAVDGFFPYRTKYSTVSADGEDYYTETFKYLSMCYALVPSKKDGDEYVGSTLKSVQVEFAEEISNNGKNGFDCYYTVKNNGKVIQNTYPSTTSISLKKVPVNHNWRTNILAGLYNTDDNKNPEDPDDPTSIVKALKVCIHLDPIFDGETNGFYNQKPGETTWENDDWSAPFPTYDPDGDEETLHDFYREHDADAH